MMAQRVSLLYISILHTKNARTAGLVEILNLNPVLYRVSSTACLKISFVIKSW